MTIADHGLKRGFLLKWVVRVGISKVNCDEVENSAQPFLLFFSIVVEFMQ